MKPKHQKYQPYVNKRAIDVKQLGPKVIKLEFILKWLAA